MRYTGAMDLSLFPIYVAACAAAASTGAFFAPDGWYRTIAKPRWTPPDWVFPVVWTTLYIFMAIAVTRVAGREDSAHAVALWSLQMVLNALWSPVFFGLHRIRDGLIVVCCVWLAVCATMIAFFQVDTLAGALFVPYLIWMTTAAALNFAIWRANPDPATQAG